LAVSSKIGFKVCKLLRIYNQSDRWIVAEAKGPNGRPTAYRGQFPVYQPVEGVQFKIGMRGDHTSDFSDADKLLAETLKTDVYKRQG
jgi:hypothetical protein